MTDFYYIIFTKNGVERLLKNQPNMLKHGEYAQKVELVVDDELFEPLIVPCVSVYVSKMGVVARVLASEVTQNEEDGE